MVGTVLFGGINFFQGYLHVLDTISPEKNLILKFTDSTYKAKYSKQINEINKIKKEICDVANLQQEKIDLKVRSAGLVSHHGNSNYAILGLGTKLLHFFQADIESNQKLKKFLYDLPNDPNDIKKIVKNLSENQKYDYWHEFKTYRFNLTKQEIKFVLSHEILGHIQSHDAKIIGMFSCLFGLSAWAIGMYINSYLNFDYSSFIVQAACFSVSQFALQAFVIRKREINADKKALQISENREGGLTFFKRLLVYNLLSQDNSSQSFKIHWDLTHETPEKRLNRYLASSIKEP